jgi:preprotein translocase subunit SecD
MNQLILAATLVATINVVLLLGLIYMYSLILIRTRASYTAGLLIFAILLLLQNVVTVYGYAELSGSIGSGLDPLLVGVAVCECGGLLALLRVTV